jgi:hypothetical protein
LLYGAVVGGRVHEEQRVGVAVLFDVDAQEGQVADREVQPALQVVGNLAGKGRQRLGERRQGGQLQPRPVSRVTLAATEGVERNRVIQTRPRPLSEQHFGEERRRDHRTHHMKPLKCPSRGTGAAAPACLLRPHRRQR